MTVSIRDGIKCFRGDDDGTAAVEFGLFTPILALALLATIDVGMAVNERILLDQALRAGAEQAMFDPGQSFVESVVEDAARIGFNVGGSGGSLGSMTLNVSTFCACPGATTTPVTCSTTCAAGDIYKYYTLNGQKTYNSIIIPQMTFNANMKVQVR